MSQDCISLLSSWTSFLFSICFQNPLLNFLPCLITPLYPNREKAMAPHSSTLAWKIPWTEEPGRLQSMGSWRVRHDWVTSLHFHFHLYPNHMWKFGSHPQQLSLLHPLHYRFSTNLDNSVLCNTSALDCILGFFCSLFVCFVSAFSSVQSLSCV